MNIYGYCRVSSADQNEDRQVEAMKDLGIPKSKIFVDKVSGKDFNRAMYQKLVSKLQKGDLLYIKSIDRLGRNYDSIREEWRMLTKELGVDVVVIDFPLLDTRIGKDLMGTFIADLVLQVLSFVAEFERTNIKQRQKEGIATAKAKGVKFGRPTQKTPENFQEIIELWEMEKISFQQALEMSGLKESTFYNKLRKFRKSAQIQP